MTDTLNPFLCRLTAGEIPMLIPETLVGLIEACSAPMDFAALARLPEPEAAEHPFYTRLRKSVRPTISMTDDGLAVVPMHGAMARRPSVWEMASGRVEDTDAIRELVEQASESSKVRGILLSVDSPGGFFTGGPELASAVEEASSRKPVIAHTEGLCGSLAYMVASQASGIVAVPSATVGSIGTFMVHADLTKMMERFGVKLEVFRNKDGKLKAPGVGGTELTDQQREYFQERAEAAHGVFAGCVTKKRKKIGADAMRGQTFHGEEARALGLVDAVGSQRAALNLLRGMIG